MLRLGIVAGLGVLTVGSAGCWYHRVNVSSPVTEAQQVSNTEWAFLWHAKRIAPDAMCPSRGLQSVVVRSNWAFSLLSVATLGLVSVAKVERHCARAMMETADTTTPGPEGGATYLSIAWGAYQKEPEPGCNGRPIAQVDVKANPFFDVVSLIGGVFAPARIRWYCVPKEEEKP
jgi:hypothetical protein